MKIYLGADHAGLALKEELKKLLASWGHEFEDLGCHDTKSCDYPDYAVAVGRAVQEAGAGALGLVVCGTGIGVSMAANKLSGIRAACCSEPFSAHMARAHNDANVLCMGERVVGLGLAAATLKAFLNASFEGGRHQPRVDKINKLDK